MDTTVSNVTENKITWNINLIEKHGIEKYPFGKDGELTLICNERSSASVKPEIISKSAPFETEESCLSLLGAPRKTTRYRTVRVKFQDSNFAWRTKTFTGFTAQIIQHETDHCNGILI